MLDELMGTQKHLNIEENDGIQIIKLQKDKANTLDFALLNELAEHFENAQNNKDFNTRILTGNGHLFSAGIDLKKVVNGGEEYLLKLLKALDRALMAMLNYSGPTIAAAEGTAIAGGFIIMACCDLRFAAHNPKAKFGITEILVGVPFPATCMAAIKRVVPQGILSAMIYQAKLLKPEQLHQHGIVSKLYAPDELFVAALKQAKALNRVPKESYALIKQTELQPYFELRNKLLNTLESDINTQWSKPETFNTIKKFVESL